MSEGDKIQEFIDGEATEETTVWGIEPAEVVAKIVLVFKVPLQVARWLFIAWGMNRMRKEVGDDTD